MSKQEFVKEAVEAASSAESAGSPATGIEQELVSQVRDFSSKPTIPRDTIAVGYIEFDRPGKSIELSAKDRKEAVEKLGTSLADMVKGELPQLKEMMQRNGIPTNEVDAKIKAAEKVAAAAKPLQDAVLSGDIAAMQKMVAQLKPEELAQQTELLQKHFDKLGLGIELDVANGQLIVSKSHGDRAVAISKDKTDVIGVNADGSYDFNRHYRRENPAQEFKGISDGAVNRFVYPMKEPYYQHNEATTKAYPEGGFMQRDWEVHRVFQK